MLLSLAAALLLAPAHAAPLSVEQLDAAWAATEDLAVAEQAPPRAAAGLSLPIAAGSVSWTDGWLLPVAPAGAADPWAAALGFVVVGPGTFATAFEDRGQAQAFANHLVLELDQPREQARLVRDEQRWSSPVTQGLVLTARQDVLDAVRAQPAAATADGKEAARIFAKRAEVHQGGQDPLRLVRLDHLVTASLGADGDQGRVLLDLDTDTALELDPDARHGGNKLTRDSWVTVLADPTGQWSTRNLYEVASAGETEGGRPTWRTLATQPFLRSGGAEDTTSPPLPPVRWDPLMADTTLTVNLLKGKGVLEVAGQSSLVMAPEGGAMAWLVVEVPFVEEQPDSWALGGIEVRDESGEVIPAKVLQAEATNAWDERWAGSNNLVLLGRPVADGEEITVTVAWKDTWPWANLSTDPYGDSTRSLGHGTGLQSAIPGISPGLVGNPWRFTTRVGIPEAQDDAVDVAISGRTQRTWNADGMAWTEAAHTATPALWGDVALGDWVTLEGAGVDGLPDLKVHLFPDEAQGLQGVATQAWHVIRYYEGLLPSYPYPELEIFQAPDMWFGFVWIAPHAMVASTQAKTITGMGKYFTEDAPHLAEGVLAHELAHQYWGHVARPGSINDFWLAESFSELFSCLYLRATFGEEAWTKRMEEYRETWEKDADQFRASLTAAYESPWQPTIVYNYGPYVLAEMLRPRLGDQAFFQALFGLLTAKSEKPVSTEEIQLAFEAASGQDLQDFFDTWVEGGFIPALALEYAVTGKGAKATVSGTVSSDVPFGTFDVPVRLKAGREERVLWVTVTDGEGRFEGEAVPAGGALTVELDPEGRVLASARKVKGG